MGEGYMKHSLWKKQHITREEKNCVVNKTRRVVMKTTQNGWSKKLLLGMSAMALAFGVMMAGCENPDSGGGGGNADVIITADNLNDIKTLIESAASGGMSKENPIVVAVTITNAATLSGTNTAGIDPLHKLFEAIPSDRYVAFDLSGYNMAADGLGGITWDIAGARKNTDRLVSITLPNTLTSIGDDAFFGCSGLTSVSIPSSVTSIGDYAFFYCIGLTSVSIPGSVTSIGEGAFFDCTNLSAIQVSASNNAYTAIDGVLFNKLGTALIAYPAGKGFSTYTIPGRVTSIGYGAFSGCSGLTSVTIPGSVTSDRKSTRLNSSHKTVSRMPSSA
jgi:hypothetical protein